MLQKIHAKLSAKLIAGHTLVLVAPVAVSVTAFGLALYVQPMPAPQQLHSRPAANEKNNTHQAPAITKVIQPAPTPSPAPPAPDTSTPTPAIRTSVSAGTPKPEPVVTPSPGSSVSGLAPTTPAPSSQVTTGYTSINWSGYLAATGTFTGISGSWLATNATGNGSTTSADSTWIGIGGVTTNDLIQVGTQNIIAANGQVSTSAFYELLPNVSQPVPGVTVSPGDSLSASISEVGSGTWTISITDKTDGESDTLTVSYASSLSSAEWIEEDPSYSSRRQIPFDNFHEAAFTGGSTVANGVSVTIAASTAQPVIMVNTGGQTIAAPSTIGSDGASFTITP